MAFYLAEIEKNVDAICKVTEIPGGPKFRNQNSGRRKASIQVAFAGKNDPNFQGPPGFLPEQATRWPPGRFPPRQKIPGIS